MSQGQYTRIEAVDVARQLELCGEAFYDEAMRHADDPSVQKLLEHLRDEERNHSRSFERLLASVQEAQGEWREQPEYQTWMASFARRRVFPSPEKAREAVASLSSSIELIDHAIRFEQQTVEFLEHLRGLVRTEDKDVIDALIAEEREHERLLRDRRARLEG